MANVKITDLSAIADPASTDVLPVVDITADTTNKISIADILKTAPEGTSSAPAIAFEGDSNTGIYHPGSEQIGFATSGTGKVFIASDGNFGIGESSPVGKLNVAGTGAAQSLTYDTENLVNLDQGDVQLALGIDSASPFAGFIQARDNTDAARSLTLNPSGGNVGIGNANPARLLQLSSSSPIIRIEDTDGTNQYSEIFQASSALYLDSRDNASSGSIIFRGISGTEFARISSSGDCGIGTGTPAEKLEVTGNLILDQTDAKLKIKSGVSGTTGAVNFTLNTDSSVFGGIDLIYDERATTGVRLFSDSYPVTIQSQVNSAVVFKRGSTETARIDSTGNLGVGTTNPGEKLEVNGTIKATDINFTGLSTFADDSAAGTGGLTAGDVYKTSTGELRIKL